MEKKFNDKAQEFARSYNISEIPWANLTKVVLAIYFVLTVLAMFARPDFLSLVIVSLGYFTLECSQYISRRIFRMLVLMALISFIYDLTFLTLLHDA